MVDDLNQEEVLLDKNKKGKDRNWGSVAKF